MRIIFYLSLTFLCLSLRLDAQEGVVHDLISSIENSIPEAHRDPLTIVEMRSSLKKIDSFTRLQQLIKISWKETTPRISEVAPTATQKTIYFKAAQILPSKDYINFLLIASDLALAKTISREQFRWALFPSEKHLTELWTENPPSGPLINLALRCKDVFADDPTRLPFFERVISGSVASGYAKMGSPHASPKETFESTRVSDKKDIGASPEIVLPEKSSQFWKLIVALVALLFCVFLFKYLRR